MNYLTKSVKAIGDILGLVMGVGYVAPYEAVMKSNWTHRIIR